MAWEIVDRLGSSQLFIAASRGLGFALSNRLPPGGVFAADLGYLTLGNVRGAPSGRLT
jgi:hypothetical protein